LKSIDIRHQSVPRLALLVLALSVLAGCSETRLVDTWQEPNYKGGPLKHLLVIGLAKDPTTKRMFEDIFCEALTAEKIQATQSYTVLPDGEQVSKELVTKTVKDGSYDGVILTRLVGKDEQTTYVPGTAYSTGWYGGGYYGAYGWGYGVAYSPGYVTTQQVFRVQTTLWATEGDGKLIWTGTSESIDPSSVKVTSKNLTRLITNQLVTSKLI
jgi:hypothetical protein